MSLLLALATACGGNSEDDARPGPFKVVQCPFDTQADIRCGTLEVPENYEKPEGRKIALAVAILEGQGEDSDADPVLFLTGGPGQGAVSGVEEIGEMLASRGVGRDVIALDQRGTGYSTPLLDCAEQEDSPEGVKKCRERLANQGVDLSQYNTKNSARDLRALRVALDTKKWNAFGISYGTRLGLELMRQDPDGLRSVVLDSTLPPDVDALGEDPRNAERTLSHVFETCAADAYCAETYPDLAQRFYTLFEDLNTKPIEGISSGGTKYKLDGATFLGLVLEAASDSIGVTYVPLIISEADDGEVTTLDEFEVLEDEDEGIADGLYDSVVCREFFPLLAPESTAGVKPAFVKALDPAEYEQECGAWDVPMADGEELMPVKSDIPTLILAGAYDPRTPPSWGEHVKETLSHAHFSLFEGASHNVCNTECGASMIADFLTNPEQIEDPRCAEHDEPVQFE